MAAAAETPPSVSGKPPLLLLRRTTGRLAAALRSRFQVLSFHDSGGAPLHAFLAASGASDPPRAALVPGGGGIAVDAAFLDAAPHLRCVVTTSVGTDHIDLAECARRGVVVAGAGGIFSADVADHAVGLLIDVLRRVSAADRYARRGLWPVRGDYPLASKLSGKRVGIIGLGRIGSSIAKRLQAFGCVIHYYSRRPKETVSFKHFPDVTGLAVESDVLVVACALNDQTRHVVNKDVLEALGKDGVLVNIARGGNVDEAAMVRALKEGEIAGAGLDVFETEPAVPPEFFSMDNVVLTPHDAAFTTESGCDLCDLMVTNLEAFFQGPCDVCGQVGHAR
ncbi:glyoxylate/hydroxypyruvate reductase HPR3 isoform X3 [Brachypodium distachyon]|uniref:glyoxylate/hydroxypyruvate reductase HPR3 isoform X3 n=1 Tax=Brachypodium distachyon TaxID=15368 RepID=UPI00071DE2E7|nr:glyoxylate/hydroxypyruvate reductase HPR3 isoform X3 [Brachypodium distachyon]|eukprot:XP_014751370.1 glyoxylate/hydroxypyruvate reductase HPR3 isoform X3 [Brachypodium distachyon]